MQLLSIHLSFGRLAWIRQCSWCCFLRTSIQHQQKIKLNHVTSCQMCICMHADAALNIHSCHLKERSCSIGCCIQSSNWIIWNNFFYKHYAVSPRWQNEICPFCLVVCREWRIKMNFYNFSTNCFKWCFHGSKHQFDCFHSIQNRHEF